MARVTPDLIVHDLHPEYISTKFAIAQDIAPTLAVQHHHAHLASCLADNRVDGPAIGVMFDGLGWGPDGTLWGGEFLVGDAVHADRAAHLAPVALPGLDRAVREPWRMAVAHVIAAGDGELPDTPFVARHTDQVDDVVDLCRSSIRTSSMGRLFDAVAALCGVADHVSYEGQAAIMLEQRAIETERTYTWTLGGPDGIVIVDPASVIHAVVDDVRAGVDVGSIAGAFHQAVAGMIADVCALLGETSGHTTVALSGGVFQNRRLVELTVPLLDQQGFTTLLHRQVPPNDGGISLGQAAVGRARLGLS